MWLLLLWVLVDLWWLYLTLNHAFQGRFVDVVVVDRCGGYMRASDDKTCDPKGTTFAEGGNCIKVYRN